MFHIGQEVECAKGVNESYSELGLLTGSTYTVDAVSGDGRFVGVKETRGIWFSSRFISPPPRASR